MKGFLVYTKPFSVLSSFSFNSPYKIPFKSSVLTGWFSSVCFWLLLVAFKAYLTSIYSQNLLPDFSFEIQLSLT